MMMINQSDKCVCVLADTRPYIALLMVGKEYIKLLLLSNVMDVRSQRHYKGLINPSP